jgi:hypothetical protein
LRLYGKIDLSTVHSFLCTGDRLNTSSSAPSPRFDGIFLSVFTCTRAPHQPQPRKSRRPSISISKFQPIPVRFILSLTLCLLRRRLSSQIGLLVFRSFCRSSVSSFGASLFCPNSFGAWFSFNFSFRFYEPQIIGLNYLRYSQLDSPRRLSTSILVRFVTGLAFLFGSGLGPVWIGLAASFRLLVWISHILLCWVATCCLFA